MSQAARAARLQQNIVTRHTSFVTCHTSDIFCHTSDACTTHPLTLPVSVLPLLEAPLLWLLLELSGSPESLLVTLLLWDIPEP